MLSIPKGVGGTVRWLAPRRPAAGPTVEVLNGSGSAEVAAGTAATLDPVSTTITATATAEATSIAVADATGVNPGDEYLLGSLNRPTDFVKVESVSGLTLNLRFPLLHTYASGSALVGTYISFVITSAVADVAEKGWVARFSWVVGAAAQPPGIVRFDIVDYGIANMPATINDARLIDPMLTEKVHRDFDWRRAFQEALNDVLRDLNATDSGNGLLTDDDWRELVALRVVTNASRTYGDGREKERLMWEEKYQIRFTRWKAQFWIDKNQDRVAEVTERSPHGGSLFRK